MRILYLMGMKRFTIDPSNDNQLGGGAEKAVIRLSAALAMKGHVVTVIGPVVTMKHNEVNYIHYDDFSNHGLAIACDTMIVWRVNGLQYYASHQRRIQVSGVKLFDVHDFLQRPLTEALERFNFKSCMVKSRFHYGKNKAVNDRLPYSIIPNGVECELIDELIMKHRNANANGNANDNVTRNPYRVCHATSLDRGALEMLENLWPRIHALCPKAEFHVYYGRLDFIANRNLQQRLLHALDQPGVHYHDRVNFTDLIREFMTSSMYLYLANDEIHEADCIALREANYCGCVPFTFNIGVFCERPGIRVPKSDDYDALAKQVVSLMNDSSKLDKHMAKAGKELSWNMLAVEWEKLLH